MNEVTKENSVVSGAIPAPDKRGGAYWMFKHIWTNLFRFMDRHRIFFGILTGLTLISLFIARAWVQPYFLFLRVHSAECVGVVLTALTLKFLWYRKSKLSFWLVLTVVSLVVSGICYSGLSPHEYLTLYLQYRSLNIREMTTLPETDFERIQPMHSVSTLANEAMSVVEQCSEPHVVRFGTNSYKFTLAIEPTYLWPRIFGNVRQILSVDATAAALNFSGGNRLSVDFQIAENLLLGRNTMVAVTRTFGPLRYLSYKALDSRYMPDDEGKIVQVVPLLRYSGVMFPKPEFGGVVVVRQHKNTILHFLKSFAIGDGEWIKPEDIEKHSFLRKQNIIPYEVARFVAESFRFQDGFFAPFPGYHRGDIRIPDLPGDMNDQPFTLYFSFENTGVKAESKLYHYFALEPFLTEKQGLNTSIFIPADSVGEILVYKHHNFKEALIGVSAVGAKVKASEIKADWTQNSIAEMRPYFHKIGGKTRFFWLSTIVTYKGTDQKSGFIAGSAPKVTLTDALYQQVVWVESSDPTSWPGLLEKELSRYWKSE